MGGDRASDGLPGAAAAAYALMPGRRCTASAHPSMNERDSQCPPRLRAVPMFDAACRGTYVSEPIFAVPASARLLTDCAVPYGR